MADKNINFNIKVNNKELDLTKVSFKEFSKIITQAKKDLQSLPLTDPRYKVLATDINTAEAAWTNAKKSAGEFGNETEKSGEKVLTYSQQIRIATRELISLEQQFGKNSTEYQNQADKIKNLRDAQEELTRGTQKLDDALSNIPGPIGQIGQAMQQVESITGSAKSAFNSLGLGVKTLDQVIKTSGVGALVLLIVTLVAALMDAAKKSEPLQRAFAVMGDAVAALFDALKPLTDFIIDVFVGAIELASSAINSLASVFGGVNKGFKQQSLELEKQLAFQEQILNGYNAALTENLSQRLKIENDYSKRHKEILDADYKNELDRNRDIAIARIQHNNAITDLELKVIQDRRKIQDEVATIEYEGDIKKYDNQRKQAEMSTKLQEAQSLIDVQNVSNQNKTKIKELKANAEAIKKIDISNKAELLKINQDALNELTILASLYDNKEKALSNKSQKEKQNLQRQYNREDIAAANERANQILELTTSLIREESARNLQATKDKLITLKEQQRIELEQVALTGVSTKNLKQKQLAEIKLANEEIRKAQLQFDANLIQMEIDRQNRLVVEAGIGTQEYFDARRNVAEAEYRKELLEADGNINKIENARTNHWRKLLEIDKEGLEQIVRLSEIEYNGLYEGTKAAFDKQRQLEEQNYKIRQANARGNYDMLEALAKQHEKNLVMIDVAELQNKSDMEQRKFEAIGTMRKEFFDEAYLAEQDRYNANVKAAGDNNALLEVLDLEHLKRTKEIDAARIEANATMWAAIASATAQFGELLTSLAMAQMNKQQGIDEQKFNNAKKLAVVALTIEKLAAVGQIIASTAIANAKAVAASPLTFGQPWVAINTVSAVLSSAAVVAGYFQQKSQIESTSFNKGGSGSASGSGSSGNQLGRNYEEGGLLEGPRHAQGGVMINAEGGEAVMTRGAVSMFGPMLSMMNQMGGGTSFNPASAGYARPDAPILSNPSQNAATIISKTYVVESELTSAQQRQARLKDLSTL